MTREKAKIEGYTAGWNAYIHGTEQRPEINVSHVHPFERDYWDEWDRGYLDSLAAAA